MTIRMLISALLLGAALVAQEQKPEAAPAAPSAEQLRAMLQQLRGLDQKAWEARALELEQKAAEQDRAAAAAREQSKQLLEQANASEVRAKALREERRQLEELRKLLQNLPVDAGGGRAAEPPPLPMPTPAVTPAAVPAVIPTPEKVVPPPAPANTAANEVVAASASAPLLTWADVEPLLSEHCVGCHDPDSNKGGLDLSSYAAAVQGGGSGKSIVPGQPDQSRLFRMIAQQERPFMPRDADALSAADQLRIRTWIEQGAAEDGSAAAAFVRERDQKAKAAAAAMEATSSGPVPMPTDWPAVALRTSSRAVPLAAMARSPRAALLAVSGLGQVLLLDGNGKLAAAVDVDLARIGSVGFSPDGRLLAVAGGDAGRSGRAIVIDVVTGVRVGTFGKERDVPLAVAVHHGARVVALAGSSKRVRVLTLDRGADGADEMVWEGKHDDFVLSLAFSPDGSLLAAADRSGACVLWEVDGGEVATTLRVPQGAVNAVAFHRTGSMVALACGDGTVRVFDTKDGKERWQKKAHAQEALAVAFGSKDAIATGGADGKMALFASDGKVLGTSAAVGDYVLGVGFGEVDEVVFGGDAMGRVQRWEGKKVEVVAELRGVGQ